MRETSKYPVSDIKEPENNVRFIITVKVVSTFACNILILVYKRRRRYRQKGNHVLVYNT